MTTAQKKAIFRQFYERVWNRGDLSVIDAFLAPSCVSHELTTPPPHRETYRQAILATRSAFPDWTVTLEDMICEGDTVAARWTAQGTHTGEGLGMVPTGRTVKTAGLTFVRVVNGGISLVSKYPSCRVIASHSAR
jgi:predicted ester cyclase